MFKGKFEVLKFEGNINGWFTLEENFCVLCTEYWAIKLFQKFVKLIFFRNHISLKVVIASSWNEATLATILSNYKMEHILNADEFGFFYQCFPNKTYHSKGKSALEGRKAN